MPAFETPLGEPTRAPEDSKAPLTCEWCRSRPAAQLVVVDWPALGRHTSLVCDPCGDRTEADNHRVDAMVWRYRLAPIAEVPARRSAAAAPRFVINIDPFPGCPHCRGACACRRF